MSYQSEKAIHLTACVKILMLLLIAVFVTELSVTVLCARLFSRIGPMLAGLLDATLLVLLIAAPLYLLFVLPVWRQKVTLAGSLPLLVQTLVSIYLIQAMVMLVLPKLMPEVTPPSRDLADACLTTLFSAPPLWWLLSRAHTGERRPFLPDLLRAPLTLYVLLLFLIFLADLAQELLAVAHAPYFSPIFAKVVDSSLTTIVISPLLWLFVVRPLLVRARSDRARADAVLERVNHAIVSIDAQGKIRRCNPAAEKILGVEPGEIRGKDAAELLKGTRYSLDELIRSVDRTETAASTHHEVQLTRKDGMLLTVDISISGVDLAEGMEYLLIMRDISERTRMERALRESEARFRQIFDQSDDAIIFFKRGSCEIIDVNATTERIFGYRSEQLMASGVELLARGENLDLFSSVVSRIGAGGIAQLDQMVNLRADGTEIIVSMCGRIMDLQGRDVVCCTFRDITARVHLEQEASLIQAKLIQANKMSSLGLLVSGIAHQINNPNNFILANSQLLDRTWADAVKVLREYREENGEFQVGGLPFSQLDASAPQLFSGIIDGSRRISDVIRQLKVFAREDQTLASVDVNQVARGAISLLHHELVRYTKHFHLELGEDLPCFKGRRQQLGQVLVNLLMNACQALPDEECGIWLSTAFDETRGEIVISIRDEGCGVAKEHRARIMEPFFTTKLDSGGTGLGLSISRSIVKDHRGELEIVSEPGEGALVTVRIPVRSEQEETGAGSRPGALCRHGSAATGDVRHARVQVGGVMEEVLVEPGLPLI